MTGNARHFRSFTSVYSASTTFSSPSFAAPAPAPSAPVAPASACA